MFLTRLRVRVGDDPDRPQPGRLWLRNVYHVHQRLCMAFPSGSRMSHDPDFLKPFQPEEFAAGQVHVPRAGDAGFLFRVDSEARGGVMVLVQSSSRPDWDYAFQNAPFLLAAAPEVKPFAPDLAHGQRLRFRLLANPTVKKKLAGSKNGRRLGLASRVDQLAWLGRKAALGGFSVEDDSTTVLPGFVYFNKGNHPDGSGQRHASRLRSVRYDGWLEVTNAELFRETLAHGIGSGKAFGFGLLSVARV